MVSSANFVALVFILFLIIYEYAKNLIATQNSRLHWQIPSTVTNNVLPMPSFSLVYNPLFIRMRTLPCYSMVS